MHKAAGELDAAEGLFTVVAVEFNGLEGAEGADKASGLEGAGVAIEDLCDGVLGEGAEVEVVLRVSFVGGRDGGLGVWSGQRPAGQWQVWPAAVGWWQSTKGAGIETSLTAKTTDG